MDHNQSQRAYLLCSLFQQLDVWAMPSPCGIEDWVLREHALYMVWIRAGLRDVSIKNQSLLSWVHDLVERLVERDQFEHFVRLVLQYIETQRIQREGWMDDARPFLKDLGIEPPRTDTAAGRALVVAREFDLEIGNEYGTRIRKAIYSPGLAEVADCAHCGAMLLSEVADCAHCERRICTYCDGGPDNPRCAKSSVRGDVVERPSSLFGPAGPGVCDAQGWVEAPWLPSDAEGIVEFEVKGMEGSRVFGRFEGENFRHCGTEAPIADSDAYHYSEVVRWRPYKAEK